MKLLSRTSARQDSDDITEFVFTVPNFNQLTGDIT